jgi:hypothetical protein
MYLEGPPFLGAPGNLKEGYVGQTRWVGWWEQLGAPLVETWDIGVLKEGELFFSLFFAQRP